MTIDAATQAFIDAATQADALQDDLEPLAQARSADLAVAERASVSGQPLHETLYAAETELGATASITLTAAQLAVVAALQPLHGAAFDGAFVAAELASQDSQIAAYQSYIADGTQPAIVQAAAAELLYLEDELPATQLVAQGDEGGPAITVGFPNAYTDTAPPGIQPPLSVAETTFVDR